MKSDKPDADRSALEEQTRALFEASVAGTDAATRSRLNQARHRALAQQTSNARLWKARGLPATAVAAAGAIMLMVMMERTPDVRTGLTTEVASDLEILLDSEDLELLEELEFYAWLDEQPEIQQVPGDANGVG